jgi:thiol-disulfide isomerase/thioredoxin
MASKSKTGLRVMDIVLVVFLVVMFFFPNIRAPVMGFAQRVLLQTGFFNANIDDAASGNRFDYHFQLVDTAGQLVEVEKFKGKKVFVNIWATWCPPCLAEMPDIAQLHQAVGDEVVFLMISVDRDRKKAKQWVREKQYSFPVHFVNGSLPESIAYEVIPTTWVVGTDGVIRYQHAGMAQYNSNKFKDFLRSL